jgi:hypothetical protein
MYGKGERDALTGRRAKLRLDAQGGGEREKKVDALRTCGEKEKREERREMMTGRSGYDVRASNLSEGQAREKEEKKNFFATASLTPEEGTTGRRRRRRGEEGGEL